MRELLAVIAGRRRSGSGRTAASMSAAGSGCGSPELTGQVHGAGDVLGHDGGLHRGLRARADREDAVVLHEHRRRAGARQRLDDALTDRVVADQRERPDRDRAAELVGHRGQHARDLLAARGPGGRVRAVRVHLPADLGQVPVHVGVRGGVADGALTAVDDVAVEVADGDALPASGRRRTTPLPLMTNRSSPGTRCGHVARRPGDQPVAGQLGVQAATCARSSRCVPRSVTASTAGMPPRRGRRRPIAGASACTATRRRQRPRGAQPDIVAATAEVVVQLHVLGVQRVVGVRSLLVGHVGVAPHLAHRRGRRVHVRIGARRRPPRGWPSPVPAPASESITDSGRRHDVGVDLHQEARSSAARRRRRTR